MAISGKLGRRTVLKGGLAAASVIAMPGILRAQPLKLRLHHFASPLSLVHRSFLVPWAKKVNEESHGAISIKVFPSMQLGGKPKDLYKQARDGVVDIVWTIPGYTANRFHLTEVFELPFVGANAVSTSPAVQEFAQKHFLKEYSDTHPIFFHSPPQGNIHTASVPVRTLEDMKGLRLRGPSRPITEALRYMGAVPVSMPLPRVTEAVSRGVVEGAALAWGITRPIRLHEVTKYHTIAEFYCLVFGLIMNKNKWNGMPGELKQVIANNGSMNFVRHLGQIWDADEAVGLKLAVKKGNEIIPLSDAERSRWKKACEPVIADWIKRVDGLGHNGAALYQEANALVAKHSAS